jgi:hypothetical protein
VPNAAWGNQLAAIYMAASQFTLKELASVPDLEFYSLHFYKGAGWYYAQITLEPGSRISHFSCHFVDSHPVDDVEFRWFRWTTDFAGGGSSSLTLDAFTTAGTPGLGYEFLVPPSGQETMHVYDPATDDLILDYLVVRLTPNVAFSGCYAFYSRQVAPAPAVATFSDVPTNHPYFRFVEALVSTGVTAGCGGGLYCVNAPITRGEMAVFLAVALGMGIPF